MKVVVEQGGFMPVRGHEDDAGLDLKSPVSEWVHPGEHIVIDTLLRMAIPRGYVGLITSKSGLMDKDITVRGTVDAGYTGTVDVVIFNHGSEGYQIKAGDKICQVVIVPIIRPEIELVNALEPTERGDNGFGSTGR